MDLITNVKMELEEEGLLLGVTNRNFLPLLALVSTFFLAFFCR